MSQELLDALSAQLDATKQMYNEAMNSTLQVRTQNIMLQKQCQDLTKQLADANAKVVELTPKPEEVPPAA